MSDWLLALILPLTLLLTILLCVHASVLRQFGAKAVYLNWLSVPLLLVFYTLVPKIFSVEQIREQSTHFESVLVFSTQVIQQASDTEYVMASSLVISALLMMFSIINHLSFKRQLLRQCDNFKPSNAQRDNKIIAEVIPHRPLKVVISHQTQSPMLVGLINPILVLPDDFAELYNTEQQQLILKHEICHFDRNDIYWNLLAFGILTLYWFHPLAWLAYFRFRRDQELSCDQTTLARKPFESRMNYGRALLITAEQTPKLAIAHRLDLKEKNN
jgi:bla regulator protein BlaR1